eukprot:COSAG01_NODE_2532_length_7493_cov_2.416960_6_plen_73_part_00
MGVQKVYFPRGQFWFGAVTGVHSAQPVYNSTRVDISLYPRLWDGRSMEVYGEGDNTHFTTCESCIHSPRPFA